MNIKTQSKKQWEHTGGGVAFTGTEFNADDDYENLKTGERVTVFSTMERHFKMPKSVRKPSDLTRLTGVSPDVLWRR